LIPKAPQLDKVSGDVIASYSKTSGEGSDNNMIQAVLNIPMAEDQFGVRLVAYRYDQSGAYRNIVGIDPASLVIANRYGVTNMVAGYVRDDIGSQLTTGARLGVLWRPTNDLQITGTFLTQKVEQHGLPASNRDGYDQANFPVAPIRRVDGDPGEYVESNIDLYNIVADYQLPSATLTATVSKVKSGVSPFVLTTTALTFPLTNAIYESVDSFTAEARLASHLAGPVQYVTGVFYEDTKTPSISYFDWFGAGVAPNPLPTIGLLATDPISIIETNRKVKQQAVFGEVSYDLTNQITGTVGGRYFTYTKDEYRLAEGGLLNIPLGTGVPTNVRSTESNHTLKANVSYKPKDDALLYASWSQGFRLGRPTTGVAPGLCDRDNDGLIDGTTTTIESTKTVDSDFLDSYEIGGKFLTLDRRWTFNVAAFHQKWTGLPVLVSLPNVGTCRGTYTANAGEAKSDGAEIDATFVVGGGLKLSAGAGYTDAQLTKDSPAVPGAVKGARLPGAGRMNGNFAAQYDFRIGEHNSFARLDALYAGDFYGDLKQTPGLKAGGYTKVDARAGMAFGALSAELFVKNLTNRDDFTWRGTTGGTNPFFGYRLRPRTIGLQLSYIY
jgi:outer membrane receptor protein involved in Fe transport